MQELQTTGRDQRSIDAFRQSFDYFRTKTASTSAEPCAASADAGYVPSKPASQHYGASCGRVRAVSDAPQVYAYKKQAALRATRTKYADKADVALGRILGVQTAGSSKRASVPAAKKPIDANKPYFAPTKEYIYVPHAERDALRVNYDAAQIGQTTFLPLCGESCRTAWTSRWNATQAQNDYCANRRATCGFENLANYYVIDNNVVADCTTGKLLDAQVHGQTTNANVRALHGDCCSQTRAQLAENNQAAFDIAQRDRDRAHARWLADKNKPGPVGFDAPQRHYSTNYAQAMQTQREITLEERRERALVLEKAQKAAKELYGDSDETRAWVASLTLNRVSQLAYIAENGMRDGVLSCECACVPVPWFYMRK